MFLQITSLSVPRISDSKSSFPSQSTFNGSSIDTSIRIFEFLRRYINISFSIQRDAYVASFIFLSGLKVFIAFIRPIVPIEIKSSTYMPVFSNFRAIYTTRRRFLSINVALTDISPSASAFMSLASSSFVSGEGSVSLPPI